MLSSAQLEALRRIPSPTISNAIERFKVRPRHEGFMSSAIRSIFPEMGAVIGYACTATVRASEPSAAPYSRKAYWDHFQKYPAPRLAVIQDLDDPPIGAFWGEVNANIHRALGCAGVITNGTVRDLSEVRALGFQFFASAVSVSHAYAHLEEFDLPVTVGGLRVEPRDLLHADQHGVVVIPGAVAPELARVCQEVDDIERPIIQLCKSLDFTTDKLAELMAKM